MEYVRQHLAHAVSGYFLVGEAPNRETVGRPHLWLLPDASGVRHSANRLLALTGWTIEQYLAVFNNRTNLWPLPNRLWVADGRQHAEAIVRQAAQCDAAGVVLLGWRVATCFGLAEWPRFVWNGDRSRPVAVVPHPSGRCRYWNDPNARALAGRFFSTLLRDSVRYAEQVDGPGRALDA